MLVTLVFSANEERVEVLKPKLPRHPLSVTILIRKKKNFLNLINLPI